MSDIENHADESGDKPEVVVTDAMIEAALLELYDFNYSEDVRFVIESVYRAMAYASHAPHQ